MSTAHEDFRKAFEAFSSGSIEEASRLCEQALARDGRDAGTLHLAAVIALVQGRPDVALARADAAIHSNRRDAKQYQTRGQANLVLRNMEAAESDFRHAIELAPDFPDAHASLGARLLERGQCAAARDHLERAVAKRPEAAQWRYNLALCESRLGRDAAAERLLLEVLRARPDWSPAMNEYGALLSRRGEIAGSVRMLEAAVRSDPEFGAAWNHLGIARLAAGENDSAQRSFERAIEIDPTDADAWTNLGNAKRRAGDRPAAERAYRTALEHRPALATALVNLGNIRREQGHLDESKAILERCVEGTGDPAAHFGLALTLLALGELERGWQEYHWRDGAAPDPAAQEAFRAALAAGHPVELVGEQGLGDVLFFLRWVPALAADPQLLTLRCDRRLHAIVAHAGYFGHFADDARPAKAGSPSIRVGDLPALLWRGTAQHPPAVPLEADPAALEAARQALHAAGPPPYVAVAWRAGLAPGASEERLFKAVPIDKLGAALRDVPGTIVSVQRNPGPGEREALEGSVGRPVLDASAFNGDIARITGMMAAVDSYVGVSSTNVHLRAGLGLGAGILVPFPPEWRYGAQGPSTPWYPDFRLYREHPSQGWDKALSAMASDIAERNR